MKEDLSLEGRVGLPVRLMVAENSRDKLIFYLHNLSEYSPEMSRAVADLACIERIIEKYSMEYDKVHGKENAARSEG